MLFTVSGVIMPPTGVSQQVVREYWANNVDDARSYFELECKADGAGMFQIHEVEANPDEILFHQYQLKDFNGSWDIVKHKFNNDTMTTDTILVGEQYNDYGMALFDCYALNNGLISEPLPEDEQYIITSKV